MCVYVCLCVCMRARVCMCARVSKTRALLCVPVCQCVRVFCVSNTDIKQSPYSLTLPSSIHTARQGCYDSSPPAALTPILWDLPDMSTLLCRQACRGADQGTVGYVIQGQSCYCSNSLVHLREKFVGNHNVSYTQCQTPCSGHAAQFCGGSGNILVYMDGALKKSYFCLLAGEGMNNSVIN